MTSLIAFILVVAVVAVTTHIKTTTPVRHTVVFWPLFVVFCLLAEDRCVTPMYNTVSVDFQIDAQVRYHTSHRNVVESYIRSERFDDFPNLRRVSKVAIAKVLLQLNGGTKASTIEAYDNLECYLHTWFNKADNHQRAIGCFTYDHLGNKVDAGVARMWESILIDGTSSLNGSLLPEVVPFSVVLKPSILEAAHAEWAQWRKERAELSTYNAKQIQLQTACLETWNSSSNRSSHRGLHYFCVKEKHPTFMSYEDMIDNR